MHHSSKLWREKHLHNNLDEYMRGIVNASERRVLFTKWVGAAWDEVSDMVIHLFEKCGISVPIDEWEDDKINVDNYTVDSEEEATDASDEDEDVTKHAPSLLTLQVLYIFCLLSIHLIL